jgi:hypothetical protein
MWIIDESKKGERQFCIEDGNLNALTFFLSRLAIKDLAFTK